MPDPPPIQVAGPRTATEFASAQARTAWDRGRAALAAGSIEAARRWYARACRIAPDDLMIRLSLAGASLAAGRPEAAGLFKEVAERADTRVAWLGLVSACLRAGDTAGAAAAMHEALSRHAGVSEGDVRLADAVVAAVGAAGWCGVDQAGRLVGRPGRAVGVTLDGTPAPDFGFGTELPAGPGRIDVRLLRRSLIGSPIRLNAIRRIEGVVEVDGNGLSGWAWHPGDPARVPVLTLRSARTRRTVRATDPEVASLRPLMQPRGFRVSASELAGLSEPIAMLGPDGLPLAGSPVSPRAVAAIQARPAPPARAAQAGRDPRRPVAVVVPVYRGVRETMDCLGDLRRTAPAGSAIVLVDDASPEPELARALAALAATGGVRLIRHASNQGFPAAANAGLRAALALDPPHDAILLNSDTRMAPGWVERLRDAVHASDDIGTATPLSNDASIASYPDPAGGNAAPSARGLAEMSRLAAEANPGTVVDVPTGVGFCLYVRRECLATTGLLREDVFAQGYGEENDFCRRASRGGWRHVVTPGAYVAHLGGRSFGATRSALLARNLRMLERLHPGYGGLVGSWIAADPLAASRRRLDLLRWGLLARSRPGGAVLLVTHDDGGGVERCVQARMAELRNAGHWPVVLRPAPPGSVRVDEPGFPNLAFRLADEADALADALRATRPVGMEVHHLLGHDHGILDLARMLAIPYDMRLHDYAAFCARITLTSPDRYCGEPDVAGCVRCVAAHGSRLAEPIEPPALVVRSANELAGARRLIAPSVDMARRMRRHFPQLRIEVSPHEADPSGPLSALPPDAERRIVVVGAIGRAKGFDVLLGCARDAAERALGLRFVVVGRTVDDEALFETGRAEITGPYREGEAAGLIAEQRGHAGFIPSLWPETWCFVLGEIFDAGLPAAAFDIGAQAERIRRTGRGWLMPLGAPAAAINRLLLAPPALSLPRLAAGANVMHTGNVHTGSARATDQLPSFESSS